MASSNSSSSSEMELMKLKVEVMKDFMFTIPLFKTLEFAYPLLNKLDTGIFRVKVDRNSVHFSGLKFFCLKQDGSGKRDGTSKHFIHISIYEGSQSMKLGEINVISELGFEIPEVEYLIDEAVPLKPGIEYEIRYDFRGQKVRYGKDRTSEPFQYYNRYVGNIGFSVQMIQGINNRVAGLIFSVNGVPQMEPVRDVAEAEHLHTLLSSNKIDDIEKHHPTCSSNAQFCTRCGNRSLKVKQNVEIHADYAVKKTIEQHSNLSVELKFRCNKRIVIDGMFFTGWTPSDATQKRSNFRIENLEIVEAATRFAVASPEEWAFTVPTELKLPLTFIHSCPIAPDVWHILKLEFNGRVMGYGTNPRSTISLDTEKEGENVVWTFDLENSKNTETLHSLVYQVNEDQSKQIVSPDQEC